MATTPPLSGTGTLPAAAANSSGTLSRQNSKGPLSRNNSVLNRASSSYYGAPMGATNLESNGPLPVFRLAGRVALITGGGGAIGIETARRILREGGNVCLVDIDEAALKLARETLKDVLASGQAVSSRVKAIVADATVEADVQRVVATCIQAFGKLDTAFLNAGAVWIEKDIYETTEQEYERIMAVNVKSAFLGLKHVSHAMRELGNGGSIILISSIAGLQGAPGHILESTSKSALRGLASTAATELGQYFIRVNTIYPSGLGSTMKKYTESKQELDELKHAVPLGRFAQVDDVASAVAFLASEDSKFMTGGLLKLDGGITS